MLEPKLSLVTVRMANPLDARAELQFGRSPFAATDRISAGCRQHVNMVRPMLMRDSPKSLIGSTQINQPATMRHAARDHDYVEGTYIVAVGRHRNALLSSICSSLLVGKSGEFVGVGVMSFPCHG